VESGGNTWSVVLFTYGRTDVTPVGLHLAYGRTGASRQKEDSAFLPFYPGRLTLDIWSDGPRGETLKLTCGMSILRPKR